MNIDDVRLEMLTDPGFRDFVKDCLLEGLAEDYSDQEAFLIACFNAFTLQGMDDGKPYNEERFAASVDEIRNPK